MNQKMAELELSLYNCKQNVQIDVVSLTIHPEVVAAAKKVTQLGSLRCFSAKNRTGPLSRRS